MINIADIDFVDTDTEKIKSNVIEVYENITGRTLANGDPIKLFLETIASIIAQQKVAINFAGKMNLLAYSQNTYLDHIGILVGTKRIPPSAAQVSVVITLSAIQQTGIVIPQGTRITSGDGVFFATKEQVVINGGEININTNMECTTTGKIGNGYVPGQLKIIVDPIAYVQSIINITTSEGGADIESDNEYRERIQLAPEQFSTAGPDGAYIYHALKASALIADISIHSPVAGTVEIIPLLQNGQIPGQDILNLVYQACNDKNIRPLTDLVIVNAPTIVNYNVNLTYYISKKNQTNILFIKSAIEQAIADFVLWQKSKLGRDINNSELTRVIVNAGAKRVEILSPAYTTIKYNQVAIADDNSAINFGGVEDD